MALKSKGRGAADSTGFPIPNARSSQPLGRGAKIFGPLVDVDDSDIFASRAAHGKGLSCFSLDH